jgi:hypothetical protein
MNTPRPKEPEPKEAKTTTKNNQSGTQQGATPPIRTESAVVTTLDDELPVNIDSDPLNLRSICFNLLCSGQYNFIVYSE